VIMVLLTGNIGALLEGILIIAFWVFIPFALLSWYWISRTKLYTETYLNATRSTKITIVLGTITLFLFLFALTAYFIFELIVS
jgi:hypothetical protein